MKSLETSADVIVVGAGLAGATAATLLARQGVRVTLVDRWSTYPACFKAEKLEPDQTALLRKFGLMDALLPRTGHIREVLNAHNGRVWHTEQREQFGIFYEDMVNGVRGTLPPTVDFQIGRVQQIVTGVDQQRVTLVGGAEHTARLLVLAGGTAGDLHTRVGLRKRMIQREQSLAFGFTIARTDGCAFPFDALTYHPEGHAGRVAYLTLFLVGTVMRANLFVYWSVNDERTRAFVRKPFCELVRLLPKLTSVIGEFDVVSKVETGKIDLYQMEGYRQPGIVLLGDTFLSVCPVTGTGLSKVLTDVDVLCHDCLPQWLMTPGMSVEKIARFYENPRKQAVDRQSLQIAEHFRRMALDRSLRWRVHRVRHHWQSRLTGWPEYFKSTGKLTA